MSSWKVNRPPLEAGTSTKRVGSTKHRQSVEMMATTMDYPENFGGREKMFSNTGTLMGMVSHGELVNPHQLATATRGKSVAHMYGSLRNGRISFRDFLRGCAALYFQSTYVQRLMLVAAVLSCVSYVLETYLWLLYDENDRYRFAAQFVEVFFFVLFAIDLILSAMVSPSGGFFYLCTTNGIIDILSLLPIITVIQADVGESGADWSFIRMLRSVKVLRVLKLQASLEDTKAPLLSSANGQGRDRLWIKVTRLALSLLTLIFVAAGFCHGLDEVYAGEAFGQGGLSWHNALYFVVVTLTTVGYGDIGPENTAARFTVMLIILIAIIVVPLQASMLAEAFLQRQRNRKRYSEAAPHIVLTGAVTGSCLAATLGEVFHDDHGDGNLALRVVVLAEEAPTRPIREVLKQPRYKHVVSYIQGSPRVPHDLHLAAVHRARAVLVFSNFGSRVQFGGNLTDAGENRADNSVLDTVSLARYLVRRQYLGGFDRPPPPVVAQVHGTRAQRLLHECGADAALNLAEIQMAILALGSVWQGFVAFALNLFQSHSTGASDFEGDHNWWQVDYMKGTDYQLFTIDMSRYLDHNNNESSKWIGQSFSDAAWDMYNKTTVLLVAVAISRESSVSSDWHSPNPEGGPPVGRYEKFTRVFLFPGDTYTFEAYDLVQVMVIARSVVEAEKAVECVATGTSKTFQVDDSVHEAIRMNDPSRHSSVNEPGRGGGGGGHDRVSAVVELEKDKDEEQKVKETGSGGSEEKTKFIAKQKKTTREGLSSTNGFSSVNQVSFQLDGSYKLGDDEEGEGSAENMPEPVSLAGKTNFLGSLKNLVVQPRRTSCIVGSNPKNNQMFKRVATASNPMPAYKLGRAKGTKMTPRHSKRVGLCQEKLDKTKDDRFHDIPENLEGHILVIGGLDYVDYFIKSFQTISDIPMVLLHSSIQSYEEVMKRIRLIENVNLDLIFHVLGSYQNRDDLKKCKVSSAESIVVVGVKSKERSNVDEGTLLATIEIEQMLQGQFFEKHIITELVLEDSVYFLGQGTGERKGSKSYYNLGGADMRKFQQVFADVASRASENHQAASWPLFAAGRVFSESMLDILTARLYYSPLEIKLWEQILQVSPQAKLDIIDETKDDPDVAAALAGGAAEDPSMPWAGALPGFLDQIEIEEGFLRAHLNPTYLELVRFLLQRHRALAVALYRPAGTRGSLLPYVQINPPHNTELRQHDKVFVLNAPGSDFTGYCPPQRRSVSTRRSRTRSESEEDKAMKKN
mmetsp:Transcript_28908/g.47517  ORF Transcript_28908/g.47517 Transcript_28908/m.47517 type:complete len:1252 (+) Transcript_28908:93-3848(+)